MSIKHCEEFAKQMKRCAVKKCYTTYSSGGSSTSGSSSGGSGDPVDVHQDCFCDPCPECGKCLEDNLKALDLRSDPNESSPDILDDAPAFDCPVCACPTVDYDKLSAYPCAYELFTQTISFDDEIMKMLKEIFDTNDRINITWEPNSEITDAGKLVKHSWIESMGVYTVDMTIQLNSNVLQNGTKGFLAGLYAHEAIHALISAYHFMDPVNAQQKFPIYKPNLVSEKYGFNEDHETMAQDYIDAIASIIMQADPAISDPEYAKLMAWNGLQSSSMFENMRSLYDWYYNVNNLEKTWGGQIGNISFYESTSDPNAKGTPCKE